MVLLGTARFSHADSELAGATNYRGTVLGLDDSLIPAAVKEKDVRIVLTEMTLTCNSTTEPIISALVRLNGDLADPGHLLSSAAIHSVWGEIGSPGVTSVAIPYNSATQGWDVMVPMGVVANKTEIVNSGDEAAAVLQTPVDLGRYDLSGTLDDLSLSIFSYNHTGNIANLSYVSFGFAFYRNTVRYVH